MAKKHIYLTEKQIAEIKNSLLTENRESKNMSKARNLLYQQGYSQENAQKTIEAIRNDVPNARLADCKFLPGVTRMYLNRELSDGNAIMKLNKTLQYVASDAHINEYDNNLNGLSVNDLVQRFAGVQQQDADASRAESYSKQYTRNPDYTIVRIPNAKTAAKYGKYTSWCVTHDSRMYKSYTNDGIGLFYFCLKNGFENIQPVAGENCPLDEYGLSMIAISITMDGELNTCTCRWNHDNGGNDSIMDKKQIEDLLGVNFYEEFKPYTREELHAKGVVLFDEVPELLASGKKPEEIFNNVGWVQPGGFIIVSLNNKQNILNSNTKTLLFPDRWYDSVDTFHKNCAIIRSNNKWNICNTNGDILSKNLWFDHINTLPHDEHLYEVCVYINNKYHKYNYINTDDGSLLWARPIEDWFDSVDIFKCGWGLVMKYDNFSQRHINYINQNGELLVNSDDLTEWYTSGGSFTSYGVAVVSIGGKSNIIKSDGTYFFNEPINKWYDSITLSNDGYMLVSRNKKYNILTPNKKLIWEKPIDEWFDFINLYTNYNLFINGYAKVYKGGWYDKKMNYLGLDGNLVWNKPADYWFDDGGAFNQKGTTEVYFKNKWFILNTNGELFDGGMKIELPQVAESKNKTIYLTEEQVQYIKSQMLNESTRDNLLLPYLNILQQKGQNVTLGELKVYLMRKFVTEANIHALSQNSNYYLAGVARYYFNGDLTSNKQLNVFYPRVTDRFIPDVCSRLDEIIMYLRNAYIDNRGMSFEQPEDFGTLSIQQLFKKYGGKIDKLKQKYAVLDEPEGAKEKKTINPKISKNYTVDIMYSYDDCRKYNQATSPGAWCITYGQQHYNGYTKNNSSHFVIFAKNNYESIPRQVGKGFPLDEYGLSLIAVQQSNTDGGFVCATTRWNHGGYGGAPNVPNADHALTYEQLKSVTGVGDEKFQEIFNVWKENAVTKKTNDRLANQRDKIDVIRKFKYIEILLRNGSTLEQLRADNRLQQTRLLYPFNEDTKVLPKVNKSILSIGIVENQKTYWTILDRGVVKVDEILCDNIESGKSKEGWHGWETKHGNSFAICIKNDKSYLYFYNSHKLLEIDGNKVWWGVEDLNETLSRIDVQEGTGYKAHTPYILWDFSRNIPIVMSNGRTISEKTSYDDMALARNNNRVVYMIGDSAAKQYYYFDKETKRFIEELNGYAIYRYIEAQNLLTLCDASQAKDLSMWGMQNVPKVLFNTNTLQVIHPCGIETFYDAAKLDAYGFMGGKGIDEAVDAFTHQYISINTSNETGAKSLFLYDTQKDDALRYPNGDVVRFVRGEIKRQHGIMVMALPYSGYSWGKCVIYNIPERRFYQNEDGSLIFYWQGENNVKDKYHVERELPFSTFGPYWYEQHKDIELENVNKLLAEGTDPNEIFDSIKENAMPKYKDYKIVGLNGVMNIYVESANRLLLNEWEEDIDSFYCDCALVKRIDNSEEYYHSENFNYVNTNGELLLKEDIGYGEPFLVDFQRAIVRQHSYGVWNLIDPTGKYMNHFGFQKIHTPIPKWLCYKTTPINKRKDRYLSINGNIFDSYIDAHEDSLHGTPEIDKFEQQKIQVAESKQKRTIYLTENQVSEIQQKIEQARKDTDKNPTEKQKQAGNYKLGRVRVLGYDIAIENPRGSIRSGKDKNGNKWQVKMKNDYGYFTHTLGYDGDAVDVFLGDHFDTYSIFAVDQKIDGEFDETKIMLGFKNEQEAKEAYMSNFNPGWKGFWKITEVPHTVFQKWLYDGYQQRKPFFEYADIQKAKLNENLDNNEEYVTLYHSTSFKNMASILESNLLRIDMPHSEGHGDMLWFSTKPNDYGNEIEFSIKVPKSEFGNDYTSFELVNKNHVVISRNLKLSDYKPSIEYFSLSLPGYLVYFKKDRIQRYIDNMPDGALEDEVFTQCDRLRNENQDLNIILDFIETNPTLLS